MGLFLPVVLAGLAAGYYLLFVKKPKPMDAGFDLTKQSIIVDGPERIRRHAIRLPRNGVENGLIKYLSEDAQTLYQSFQLGRRISGDSPCLGARQGEGEYTWMTYNEVHKRFTDFGSGLISLLNLGPNEKPFLGIYSQNRPEWVIAEQACNAYGMVCVPLYDTLGSDAVKFIVNQAEIRTVVIDAPKIKSLRECLPECKDLKLVVKIGEVTEEEAKLYGEVGVNLVSMSHVEKQGAANPAAHRPPLPEDIATICYTSGTTGDPKGAILTHANMIADAAAPSYLMNMASCIPVNKEDVHISYLPLAHMFERLIQLWLFTSGARIGFFRGDVKLLVDDIKVLRPTVFPSVPRLLNRIYDKVVGQVEAAGGLKAKLFYTALAAKEAEVLKGIVRNNSIWDKIVFKKVQQSLGGRVRFIITGAAPISTKVLQFLRSAFGCIVLEGYGQTESSAGSNITSLGDFVPGHVGPPFPCNEIKLVDVPDMNYFSRDDKGEVCFRGHNVMKGYLKNPEKTREAIDDEGWLHSGDIGMWLPNGTLKIIDRKKAIFKLAQGEYIAPEKIENVYLRANAVAQTFVYGNSLKSALVCIIVPDEDRFKKWAMSQVATLNGNETTAEMCSNKAVEKAMLAELIKTGNEAGLKSFEQVRAIRLTTNVFTVENNLLTPTMKSKRPQLEIAFKAEIDAMYAEIPE